MRYLSTAGQRLVVLTDATALPLPPMAFGVVPHSMATAAGTPPEIDVELWADAAVALTNAEIVGGIPQPFTKTDSTFTVASAADDVISITGHGYLTGDGPLTLTNAGGVMPGGLSPGIQYWAIKGDADHIALAVSLFDAMVGTAVDLTTDGTGTTTIHNSAMHRVRWHGYGFLGYLGDGAVSLDGTRGYTARVKNRGRAVAYGLVGSVAGGGKVSAALYSVADVD